MKSTTYTIHRGTVRSAPALYHHVMPILARASRANDAIGKATAGLAAINDHIARIKSLKGWETENMPILAKAHRDERTASAILRAAQSELRNATSRTEEASKMHLVEFVPPYVPAKASRVYPALNTCTSPRRAFAWQVKTGRIRHDPTIATTYPTL